MSSDALDQVVDLGVGFAVNRDAERVWVEIERSAILAIDGGGIASAVMVADPGLDGRRWVVGSIRFGDRLAGGAWSVQDRSRSGRFGMGASGDFWRMSGGTQERSRTSLSARRPISCPRSVAITPIPIFLPRSFARRHEGEPSRSSRVDALDRRPGQGRGGQPAATGRGGRPGLPAAGGAVARPASARRVRGRGRRRRLDRRDGGGPPAAGRGSIPS